MTCACSRRGPGQSAAATAFAVDAKQQVLQGGADPRRDGAAVAF